MNKTICDKCNGMGILKPVDIRDAGFNGYINCDKCSGSGINIDNVLERLIDIFDNEGGHE